jgi:hypothetical protein
MSFLESVQLSKVDEKTYHRACRSFLLGLSLDTQDICRRTFFELVVIRSLHAFCRRAEDFLGRIGYTMATDRQSINILMFFLKKTYSATME